MLKRTVIIILSVFCLLLVANFYTFVIQPMIVSQSGIQRSSSFIPWLFSFNYYSNNHGNKARVLKSAWGSEEVSFYYQDPKSPQVGYHRATDGTYISAVSMRVAQERRIMNIVREICETQRLGSIQEGIIISACVAQRDGVAVQVELSKPETITDITDRVVSKLGNPRLGEFVNWVLADQDIRPSSVSSASLAMPLDDQLNSGQESETLFVIPSNLRDLTDNL